MQETKPLSGREYAALQSLFAAVSHMQALMPTPLFEGYKAEMEKVFGKDKCMKINLL